MLLCPRHPRTVLQRVEGGYYRVRRRFDRSGRRVVVYARASIL